MKKIAVLNISDYRGMVANAEHYYGTLTLIEDERVTVDDICSKKRMVVGEKYDVKKILSKEDIEYLTKKDSAVYFEGDYTLRFNNKQDVIDAGVKLLDSLKLNADFIILYNHQKEVIRLERFFEYLMTNDDNQILLYLNEDFSKKYTPEETYKKYYKSERELRWYSSKGLKYIPVYKEHPLAKYKYGQVFLYKNQENKDWKDYKEVICGIIIINNIVSYFKKPINCEGHYDTRTEENLDEHYILYQI